MKAESKKFIRTLDPLGDVYVDIDTGNRFLVVPACSNGPFAGGSSIMFMTDESQHSLGEYKTKEKANTILNKLIDDIGYIYGMQHYEKE